ncbi:MAG: TRAP transporter substrate-binding protein DctP [Clostridiaceae bacterium]|jgi:TRAP-type C4-dicarboxylate transport system substrate-binding protein|nr:TRAP transporter substrate-binding protein DctP [Clostridiaceae bacterium]
MRKILAILLALLMVFAVAACGNGSGSDPSVPGKPSTTAPKSSETESPGPGTEGPAYDTVKLMFATTYNELETSGKIIVFFTNYITEKSGGAVTFDIKWGGTVAGTGEELSFLQAGAFDMSVLGQSQYSAVFPLLNFPGQTDESQEKCVNYFRHIVYENDATASLIQAQIEAQGVKMLGFMGNGGNAFAAKKELSTLDELNKYKLGIGMNHSAFERLGFSVQALMPWDTYDGLSKGVVDVTFMALAPMVALKWHEVAPYFVSANVYSSGNYFTISLERWNSFSADTKALFEEAMAAATDHSLQLVAEGMAGAEAALTAAGGKLMSLNEADTQALFEVLWDAAVADGRALAKSGNCVEEMETILNACADYLKLPLN